MIVTPLNTPWLFDPARPRIGDYAVDIGKGVSLPDLETSLEQVGEYQRRLRAHRKRAVLLIVQGLDASGKDSLIRTLATYMDPAGFHAWSFSRPQGVEERHDFLWRVSPFLPAYGAVAAFNRSHHEAVIAERVWPVRSEPPYDWKARYAAIRAFETHLSHEGTTVIKCWLRLSEDEHRRRLLRRLEKPRKRWKFDPSDIDGWRRRDEYLAAAEDAIAATHTTDAPWLMIPGNRKSVARSIVAAVLAEQLQKLAPDYPTEDETTLKAYRKLLEAGG